MAMRTYVDSDGKKYARFEPNGRLDESWREELSNNSYWNSLPEHVRNSIIKKYSNKDEKSIANVWGLFGLPEHTDYESLLADLAGAEAMTADYAALGDRPTLDSYLNSAYDEINAQNQTEFDALDQLLSEQRDIYNQDMADISSSYDSLRTGLMSQQYQQNLQTMDTLQSDMSRTRQNALEAGASAGIRIAGNVNALLSAQNKQSATSMDTANQLAQMMINQRNEESAARRGYQDYLQSDNAARRDLRLSTDSRAYDYANSRYDAAAQSYDSKMTDLDNKYGTTSGLYDFRHNLKSKYSSGGTQ
jgi:hypothetical protein